MLLQVKVESGSIFLTKYKVISTLKPLPRAMKYKASATGIIILRTLKDTIEIRNMKSKWPILILF